MTAQYLSVVTASVVAPYTLAITFDDGETRTVDFGLFLRNSRHPAEREYLAPERFAAFTIRNGNLMWGDYDLIFPVEDLYAGSIQ